MKKLLAILPLVALVGCTSPKVDRLATEREISNMGAITGAPAVFILACNLDKYTASAVYDSSNKLQGVYGVLEPRFATNKALLERSVLASSSNVLSPNGLYVPKDGYLGPEIKTIEQLKNALELN